MSDLLRDRVVINAPPEAIWALIEDPSALARVLPGAESISATGPDTFHGVLAARVQFLTLRADVDASYHDADPPRHLRLELTGRPRGLAGSFTVSIPFDLAPAAQEPGGAVATEIRYAVELQVTGRLTSFGAPLLRDTFRRQISQLVSNVDRELTSRTRETQA